MIGKEIVLVFFSSNDKNCEDGSNGEASKPKKSGPALKYGDDDIMLRVAI